MKKGFTLIEVMIALCVIGILTATAIPFYADYTRKARAAEVPPILKKIVEIEIAYRQTPPHTEFTTDFSQDGIAFNTSMGGNSGKFFIYSSSAVPGCDIHGGALPEGLANASPVIATQVPDSYKAVCMGTDMNLIHL